MITTEIRAIANKYGVELCDHCGEPEAFHVAFDHKHNRCTLAYRGWGIGWIWKTTEEKENMARCIKAFDDECEQLEEAQRQIGAGI